RVLFPAISASVLYALSLHDALPISLPRLASWPSADPMMHGNFGEMPMVCATCLSIGGSCVVGETIVLSCVCLTLQMSSASSSHRSEEHTSELQSRFDLVCRLLLEKK